MSPETDQYSVIILKARLEAIETMLKKLQNKTKIMTARQTSDLSQDYKPYVLTSVCLKVLVFLYQSQTAFATFATALSGACSTLP